MSEYKIHNADITLRYDASTDDLIDVVEGNRTYIPCIYLLNKIDQISVEVTTFDQALGWYAKFLLKFDLQARLQELS